MPVEENADQNKKENSKERIVKETDNNLPASPDKKRQKQGTPEPTSKSYGAQIFFEGQPVPARHDYSGVPGSQLPIWVGGSSPAKYFSLSDLIKAQESIEKMAIVHQIAVEPNCKVEDFKQKSPKDSLHDAVKCTMHKAFWDMLREELARDPPQRKRGMSLLVDLKSMITEHVESANLRNALTAVNEALDLDHLRHLDSRNVLNFNEVLQTVLSILERLCAPIRDELVAKLKGTEDTMELFKGIFELVELMRVDMANFTLSQARHLITSQSSKIELDEFMKLYEMDNSIANNTRHHLRRILKEFLAERDREANKASTSALDESSKIGEKGEVEKKKTEKEVKEESGLSRAEINELILRFFMHFLSFSDADFGFPETLKMDEQRIEALSEKLLQLELLASALFATSNLAGRAAVEATPSLKEDMKRELIVLLNDVNKKNCAERLESVAVQCCKHCSDAFTGKFGWTEERSKMLKQQELRFVDPEEAVRKIAAHRIRDFVRQALRQSGEPLRVPPGLSVLQSELAAFTSRFYSIAIHNWNTFGRFYAQILDEEFKMLKKGG